MPKILKSSIDKKTGQFCPTHGMTDFPEYTIWANMIYRCENSNCHIWDGYGGRGISVCPEWRLSFERFISDMGRRPSHEYSIDRIDVDGNYEPRNCKWSSYIEQSNNRRNTVRINGLTIRQVSEKTGLTIACIKSRIQKGWSADRIVSQPMRRRRACVSN